MRSTMMDVPLTVGAIMRHGTAVCGDREVVTCTGDGTRSRSYAEVGRRATALAGALRRLGVHGDERVATFMWNNAEHLEAYLAVPSMGAVLHTLNIRLAADQLSYIAGHAEDRVVIVDGSLVPLFAAVLPSMKTVRDVIVTGDADLTPLTDAARATGDPGPRVHSYEELVAAAEPFSWPEIDERSAAAMCYTSGTTGNPKGVVYSHRSTYLHTMGTCMGNAFGLSLSDRVLPVVPMFHANAWGLAYAAIMAGADLIMPDRYLQAEPLCRLIQATRPTIAGGVPTVWSEMLRYVRANGTDVSSLRVVVCGGSAAPHALQQAFQDELGIRMLHAWGMTETSPLGSTANPPPGLPDDEAWWYRDSQGIPFCMVEARLAGEGGKLLPHDGSAVGEIEVRGPWVTGAYYGNEGQDRFDDGWLRTGDVGTIGPRGYLRLTDRAKDVIKSGGEWISSVELENALMAHPDVIEAAVLGVTDQKWGERPLAAVVRREGATVTPAELRAFLAERVPKWQLPERWAFIGEVPKTSVGKFAKIVLRKQHANGEFEVVTLDPSAPGQG